MEKYTTYQNIFTGLAAFCQILAILFGLGVYHFKNKKEALTQKSKSTPMNDTSKKNTVVYNIKGDYVSGQKTDNHKTESTFSNKQEIHNNPNALIITQNQSGGQNIVNYNGGKLNPANQTNNPIFDEKGYYGLSILNDNCKILEKEKPYSFAAKIPVNTKLRVIIQRIGEDKRPMWGIKLSSEKNWRYNNYDNSKDFSQIFDLDDEFGDLFIIFSESGEAKIEIFYNDNLINEKIIKWQ